MADASPDYEIRLAMLEEVVPALGRRLVTAEEHIHRLELLLGAPAEMLTEVRHDDDDTS